MTKIRNYAYQGIRAHVSGSYRTETLHDKEYIVVPVVALVEGVIKGLSASGPELALAEEFGKFPDSWNGRPVVMSHPLKDDKPVSANSPKVLEAYQIGFLFNTKMDGKKLVQEAWIDINMAASGTTEAFELLKALQKGEMIEVSTGYFALIEPSSGLYNNQEYEAIQRSVVPDHLAFLPLGTIGACSNADGCGAQLAANSSPDKKFDPVKDFRIDNAVAPCCDKCTETGGSCIHDNGNTNMPANADMASQVQGSKKKKKTVTPKAYEAKTIANTIPDGVLLGEVRDLVTEELQEMCGSYCYVIGLTTTHVIYDLYNMMEGDYDTYQQSYTIDAQGNVTLGNDPLEVTLMTTIVPDVGADDTVSTNASGTGESSMTTSTKPGQTPSSPQANATKEPRIETVVNDQGTLEINFDAEGKATGFKLTPKANAKPATTEEFIAQAPKEMQEVLKSSLALHESQKKALIAQIKDTKRCKMSDDKLNAMSLQDLQELAELANVQNFEGRALPNANASEEDQGFTPAPLVFEAPKDKVAA